MSWVTCPCPHCGGTDDHCPHCWGDPVYVWQGSAEDLAKWYELTDKVLAIRVLLGLTAFTTLLAGLGLTLLATGGIAALTYMIWVDGLHK